ncbi:hypothetical protein STIAU_4664 [Stigmatella aurantiaca DW4/3-1]|uniref:Uncharacterized protein n=1 Tax=Stigmatella aurantiaca (strain DW4/3-1) TaxID=378806 RepID=Q08X67_STIAD|nr:hypothetical protein STIAU_4664 [Stigmatella aurantiaca DW4/3-1]
MGQGPFPRAQRSLPFPSPLHVPSLRLRRTRPRGPFRRLGGPRLACRPGRGGARLAPGLQHGPRESRAPAVVRPHGAGDGDGVRLRPGGRLLRLAPGGGGRGHGGPHGVDAHARLYRPLGAVHRRHRAGLPAHGGEEPREGRERGGADPGARIAAGPAHVGAGRAVRPAAALGPGRLARSGGTRRSLHPGDAGQLRHRHAVVSHQRHPARRGGCGHLHAGAVPGQLRQHRAGPALHLRPGARSRPGRGGRGDRHHPRAPHGGGLPAPSPDAGRRTAGPGTAPPAARALHDALPAAAVRRRHPPVRAGLVELAGADAHRRQLRQRGHGRLHPRHADHPLRPATLLGDEPRRRHPGGPEPGGPGRGACRARHLAGEPLHHSLSGRGEPGVPDPLRAAHPRLHDRSRRGAPRLARPADPQLGPLPLRLCHNHPPRVQRRGGYHHADRHQPAVRLGAPDSVGLCTHRPRGARSRRRLSGHRHHLRGPGHHQRGPLPSREMENAVPLSTCFLDQTLPSSSRRC